MQQAGIQPEIQMPNVPVWRTLDYSAVVRVFGNIINNTIRYSDGDFEVHLEEKGKILMFSSSYNINSNSYVLSSINFSEILLIITVLVSPWNCDNVTSKDFAYVTGIPFSYCCLV